MTLDNKTLAGFKEKLLAEKIRLEKNLSRFASPTDTPGDFKTNFNDIGTDRDENASEVEEYSDNLALEDNLEGQIREINEALEKIENGTFGLCQKCQKEIGLDRLEAYPAAKECMDCATNK